MKVEKITMPQLGESVTEGTISQWLVEAGDTIEKYDPLAEVLTDKVNAEVPSSFAGTIKEIVAEEGATISVGDLMCYIEVEGEETASVESNDHKKEDLAEVPTTDPDTSMKKRYSPAVLRMAQEHNIDLENVKGTGKSGRITRKDIELIIDERSNNKQPEQSVSSEKQGSLSTSGFEKEKQVADTEAVYPMETTAGDKEIPVTGVRKAIAQNMVRSVTEIPHAWMMIEVDVTNLVTYRNAVKKEFKEKEGHNLTVYAFFIKAVARALKEFPEINSSWAGSKIIQKKDINISIAVAKDKELYVPVIKDADQKSINGISKNIHTLALKARAGKLTTEDMKDGTFTINNTGSFGSVQSMGVINYPQAAILQVESIIKKPVIIDGMFAARDMVNLCLSLDHRVLDGLICGQFMARVKEILESASEKNMPVY